MRSEMACILLLAASAVLPAATSEKSAVVEEPRYDPATEISVLATITDVREVPRGNPLSGIHLTVKSGSQVLDVHLGPAAFIKQFEIRFSKGDEVRLIGSMVKTGNGIHTLLAREVRKDQATLSCRRANGQPNWE